MLYRKEELFLKIQICLIEIFVLLFVYIFIYMVNSLKFTVVKIILIWKKIISQNCEKSIKKYEIEIK